MMAPARFWGKTSLRWVFLLLACAGEVAEAQTQSELSLTQGSEPSKLRSVCDLEAAGQEPLRLILEGVAWKGKRWPQLCEMLRRYLGEEGALETQTAELSSAPALGRLLAELPYLRAASCLRDGAGPGLSCTLTPAWMVKRVKLEGKIPFAVLKEDLRRRVFVRPGLIVKDLKSTLERQRERLESFFELEGYFKTEVQISYEATVGAEPAMGLILHAKTHPGPVARLSTIELSGALPPELTRQELEAFFRHRNLGLWDNRFIPRQAEEDAKAVVKVLTERGYPEARLRVHWRVDETHHQASLQLVMDAGHRVVVRFLGNLAIHSSELRAALSFRDSGVVDSMELDTSAAEIRKLYEERGYAEIKVSPKLEEPEPGTLWVSFEIKEGARSQLAEVSFEGNTVFEAEALRREATIKSRPSSLFRSSRWVEALVEADRRSIRLAYKRSGYAATKVTVRREAMPDHRLRLVFEIQEGARRFVKRMQLGTLPKEIDAAALEATLSLRTGTPYVHSELGPDRRRILASLVKAGYASAEVKRSLHRPTPEAGGPATIDYRIVPGLRRRLGGVIVSGNFRTRSSLIEERLALNPGDPLDILVLGKARRALLELGPFSRVQLAPLALWRETGTTWLSVAVQERRSTSLDLVLAYSTDDNLSFGLDLSDRNLLGRAVRLDARLRGGWIFGLIHPSLRLGNADTADLSLFAPRPFGLPFDLQGSGYYRFQDKHFMNKADFLERRIGLTGGLSRILIHAQRCSLCPTLTAGLRYGLSANELQIAGVSTDKSDQGPANVGRLSSSVSADWRDSALDPRRGAFVEGRFELARAQLSPLPEGTAFDRIVGSAQGYLNLGAPFAMDLGEDRVFGGPLVLALGARVGWGVPRSGATSLPDSEAFSYGGDSSVRGLPLRASAKVWPKARTLLESTFEVRWYLLQNVGFGSVQLAFFADFAAASERASEALGFPTLSVGPVLRYVTPVGPISLAWGSPVLLPEALAATVESGGRFHLTFGYTF